MSEALIVSVGCQDEQNRAPVERASSRNTARGS
jgi:hypothetical protein